MLNTFQKAREPISSYSHFIGAILSVVGLGALSIRFIVIEKAGLLTVASGLLFCLSLIALYSASGYYHFIRASEQVILAFRKLDHAMIYVLIAGTYTPVLFYMLPFSKAVVFVAGVWSAALLGIIIKLCWFSAPRWLGTSLYLIMGWAILADIPALISMTPAAMALLAGGGICYTIGGVIYMIKRPNLSPRFGFHELFHMFVILGSAFHYFLIFFFIV